MKSLLLFTFILTSFDLAAQPKVISQFTQHYFPNFGEWIGDEKAFFYYDDEERLIRKETFDYTRHKTRLEKLETWTYSTSGELIQQTLFEVNGLIYTDTLNWYYNDVGQLDSLINIHYSSEWRLEVWKYKMKYEGENLVEFQQTYTPDWLITPPYSDTLNNGKEIVFQHSFYEYNDEGCLSQKINIHPQSHVEKSDKETFEYGENCQLIKSFLNISNFLNPDTLARKYRRFHSSDVTSNYRIDTIYSERFYNSSSNWEYDSLVIFKYDEQDRLIEKEFDSEIFYNSGKELWEYNGDGQLVKYFKSLTQNFTDIAETLIDAEITYTYDDNGFLIKKDSSDLVSDIHFSWKYENFCDGLPNTIYSSRIGGSLGVQSRRDVFEYDTPLNCELFDEDISLQLFPNPAHHFINIESPILQKEGTLIQVFDAMGRLQITQKIDIHSNRFEINLRGLEKGFYTLVIENEEDRLIEKFVLQN